MKKKLLFRISVIFFAVFYGIYSSLYSFCVPVYASALPSGDPSQYVPEAFKVIEGGSGSGDSTIDLSQYSSFAMEMALMSFAQPGGGYDGICATEKQVAQMVSDFTSEYGDDVYRVAVAQPGEALKTLLWDYPNQMVGAAIEGTNAGLVVLADGYVSISQSLMDNMHEFLGKHIKHNVYYSDISAGQFKFCSYSIQDCTYSCTDERSGITYNYYINHAISDIYHGVWASLSPDLHVINFHVDDQNLWIHTDVNNSDTLYSWFNYPSVGHCSGCSFPIFDSMPDFSKSDWWKDSVNFFNVGPNIVTPLNNPIPVECPDIFHIPECQPYLDASRKGALDNQKLPSEEPDQDPEGFPIIEPDPITVPEPVPSPVPIPEIIPIIEPDPSPDPDPNPTPDPDPDPDPYPDPTPDPDPDPDPTPDPDPDPIDDDPDFDFDYRDDSGGNPLMDLSRFFPFCLPMDLYLAFKMLNVEAKAPVFNIPVNFHLLNGEEYNHVFTIDIVQPAGEDSGSAEPYVKYLRFFLTFLFIVFLIFATIKITPH